MAEQKENEKEETRKLSRREFLRNAGLLVGGTAIGSSALLAACGENMQTVTSTITNTITETNGASTVTVTTTTPAITITAKAETGEVAEAIIKLNINGNDIGVMVRPNWTLQHVLNDKLGLIGTKEWCDAGACGSCTVIMDGRPVLSCMMLAIECTGKQIEHGRGMAASGHPIIRSYKNNNCMQCGYCTQASFRTAKALLDTNANPTKD
jgi:aerobic-type carbon monoxide dehydrogenase small subunit (CoxS/CutS family)